MFARALRIVAALLAVLCVAWIRTEAGEPALADLLAASEILSRPTSHGVTVRIVAAQALTLTAEWGTSPGRYDVTSAPARVAAGDPFDVVIDGLSADTQYFYRLRATSDRDPAITMVGDEHTFHTQRRPGSPFVFTVQADPHMDENSSGQVYAQALRNQLADRADFLMDLGDASMADRCIVDGDNPCSRQKATAYEQISARNALMRSYFSAVAHSLPLFMVLGNHEGEAGWAGMTSPTSVGFWDLRARKFFYANPEPNDFFTGNDREEAGIGRRQNYYAFEWGDALFVALDPFGYTMRKPARFTDDDMWEWTLGDEQYHWLERTLQTSRARFKFVFSHHMTGGSGPEARGGTAFASTFEWGGQNIDGSWGFATRRPGWSKPIHQLLVDTGVTAWFHGHDHLYAREQRDGVIYQEVPQPSTERYEGPDLARDYGYEAVRGVNAFVNPGHLRVTVQPTEVRVEFVRAVAPGQETATLKNAAVLTSYTVR